MNIRKAKEKDSLGIAKVSLGFYDQKNIKNARKIFFQEKEKGHNFIVAIDKGKIIGFVSWFVEGMPKHGLTQLYRIVVEENYRRKGIGKLLINQLEKDAKIFYKIKNLKLRKLFLTTNANNKDARRFYQKAGFIYEARLKSHYYSNNDELVYSKFFI